LVKHITPGEHVKIVSGRDQGATGRVVSIFTADGENLAVVLTDGVNTEIQCHINALQVSSEVSSGQGNLLGYEVNRKHNTHTLLPNADNIQTLTCILIYSTLCTFQNIALRLSGFE